MNRSFFTMPWISSRACSFVVIVSIAYLRSPAAPEEMAQPRRDFPPGKAPYSGGIIKGDLSPAAGQVPPERRQEEALRENESLRLKKRHAGSVRLAAGSSPSARGPLGRTAKRLRPSCRRSGPSRRRSRFAARRTAGTSNRSRQPTGDPRPPSLGERSRKGIPLPGFRRQRRKESGSFFPAACTAEKILLTERSVGGPVFAGPPAPERSAMPSSQRPGGAETGPPSPKCTEEHLGEIFF